MANLDLLECSIPVAPIKIVALKGCTELGNIVNDYLVSFRKEMAQKRTDHSNVTWSGYAEDTFLVDAECPRFGTGEAKGKINASIRGADLFIMVDISNYTPTYKIGPYVNHMSPDDHYQDLKRIIAALQPVKHDRINVIMPFLYEGRQHKRSARESLDCASGTAGAGSAWEWIISSPLMPMTRVLQNAIPLSRF